MATQQDLAAWRDEFPITQTTNYLVSNSLGAMPRSTRDSLAAYADLWERRGVRSWAEGWWTMQDEVAQLLAPILGCPAPAISMHQNVTIASAVFASALDFTQRNKIVFTELNFPSLMYLYEGIARQQGCHIERIASPDGIHVPTDDLLDAIDDETALVPISHVLFRSAFIQDAKAIVAKARSVGAIVLLDVFQSVGTVPLHLEAWGVHAAVGGALKFLCGGPGNVFLYVDPDLTKDLYPAFTGWMAHKRPFDFDPGPQDLRNDGWRFLHGTPNVPALYAGRAGIRILGEVGIERVREQSMRQTARLYELATARDYRVHAPADPEVRGGTIAIDVPHGYEVCQELLSRDIIVDYRPGAGIRIAPHFYTLDAECEAAIAAIDDILETRAYERFVGKEHKPG
ncbi:MAG: aminotransferase class V-fold PLP-dependent enzyme [Planctomycetes bacterium]|nr:aminotransferase class V-fold PLP-dependent enzyme [Planctomycetota bacterium]MCB9891245.1 aminotransferase class V-fold PLP-dependent enzyme [Planctomycetota bacterium]MCB9919496.1 aminotransferase class V-fold PLP-dependent enzyme [Planctomycetota bacterium]